MTDAPIRLTKNRARAMLECFERGRQDEYDSLREAFGVTVSRSGEITLDDEDFALLDTEQALELKERIETLSDAVAAATIFAKRYL